MRIAILALCTAIAAGIFIAMLLETWRYRLAAEPGSHFHQRLGTELLWAVVPCALLLMGAVPAGLLIVGSPGVVRSAAPGESANRPAVGTPGRCAIAAREARPGAPLGA